MASRVVARGRVSASRRSCTSARLRRPAFVPRASASVRSAEPARTAEEAPAPAPAPPPVATAGRQSDLALRIDGEWYDCSGWAKAHPGGARFIEFFHGRDATDAFYALHSSGANGSDEALQRLRKLPRCDPPEGAARLVDTDAARACESFNDLRLELERDGWFERDVVQEGLALANVVGLFALGTAAAWTDHPLLATLLLGVGGQQAGWLGHDYIHGRGWWCKLMRATGGVLNGHSTEWWTQKHSMHHTFTNQEGRDEDIMQEPVFFLRSPTASGRDDSPMRKFQHLFGYPAYAITFWYWRYDSLRSVIARKDKAEGVALALNYLWMLSLGWPVAIGHVLLSGFLVGSLVSATHQSEEMMFEHGEFVDVQFRSTRDADVENALFKYLWGGMDTQLEHHLFPTMPRYRYHELRPVLQAWAEEHGHTFRISPSLTILKDNWRTLRDVALSP